MMSENINQFHVKTLDGQTVSLQQYKNCVLLIVNTASECGFTLHYTGLEKLYLKYKDLGLVILGFPCNQFGGQEPGTVNNIEDCLIKYGVTFPVFSKIEVNGINSHPLFQYLKKSHFNWLGGRIKWNFTKFLISKDGKVRKRFAPMVKPEKIEKYIIELLELN